MPAHRSGAAFSGARRRRHLQHKPLVDDHRRGVAALGHGRPVLLDAAVGEDEAVVTVLLLAALAGFARAAGINETPDRRDVAGFELSSPGCRPAGRFR